MSRSQALLPNGIPRYVRCYYSDDSIDSYTVVFSGRYKHKTSGEFIYLGMSEHPTWATGVGQHGSSPTLIDRPSYGHLGKKISFKDLPEDCQKLVLLEYKDLWDIKE